MKMSDLMMRAEDIELYHSEIDEWEVSVSRSSKGRFRGALRNVITGYVFMISDSNKSELISRLWGKADQIEGNL